jgi:hypothetical protein
VKHPRSNIQHPEKLLFKPSVTVAKPSAECGVHAASPLKNPASSFFESLSVFGNRSGVNAALRFAPLGDWNEETA